MMEGMEENHVTNGAVSEGRAVHWYLVLGAPVYTFDDSLLIEEVRRNEHLEQVREVIHMFFESTGSPPSMIEAWVLCV
jgi:hypothetical protein